MSCRTYVLWSLLAALVAVPAQADLMISFSEDGSLFDVTIDVGEEVQVPVYIRQTEPDTVLTDPGLVAAGVQINFDVSGANATVTDVYLDPVWKGVELVSDVDYDNAAGVAIMWGSVGLADAVQGEAIFLGTVTFRGNVAGDITMFESSRVDWAEYDRRDEVKEGVVWDAELNNLDDQVFAVATLGTIRTVPEPSTLFLLVVGVSLFGCFRRFRRRISARG